MVKFQGSSAKIRLDQRDQHCGPGKSLAFYLKGTALKAWFQS